MVTKPYGKFIAFEPGIKPGNGNSSLNGGFCSLK
jgi:hypothetical protein